MERSPARNMNLMSYICQEASVERSGDLWQLHSTAPLIKPERSDADIRPLHRDCPGVYRYHQSSFLYLGGCRAYVTVHLPLNRD